MNDQQLLRYNRQMMLSQLDYSGQQKLLNARVLVVGVGGLGSPVAMYLAAAGVGHLTVVDFDQVDLSNLQRQIIHTTERIGMQKVASAKVALSALNPEITIETIDAKLEGELLHEQVALADVVVDASDNFSTRFSLSDACVEQRTALVSGAAIRFEGQVTVFRNDQNDSPCYRCLYKDEGELEERCSESGVLAPVVGIIGSIQATEAIKVITGMGQELKGRLLILDALSMEWRTLKLKRDPSCHCH